MSTEDEVRAAAYRAQELRRLRFQQNLARSMRGSETAKRVLTRLYAPLTLGHEVPLIGEDRAD